MSEPAKEAAAAAAPAPASSSKLMPILLGFNSLLMVGVVGFMAYSTLHKPPPPPSTDESHEEGAEAAPAEEHGKAEGKGEGKAEGKEGKGEKHGEGAPPPIAGAPGPIVRLPDFVVHLRNPDLDRYARITFEIEVFAESDKDRLTANFPRVRDAFISYLSDRTVEELRGSEGLGRTKDALQQRLRDMVPEARVRALYISDFVVQ